jgi:hypothetical protein
VTAEPTEPTEQPDDAAPDGEPEPVYDTEEAALVAQRLEALGYIE